MAEAIALDVIVESADWRSLETDVEALASRAIAAAAAAERAAGGVALLLADDASLAALNRDWRGKPGPTNVLSFPAAPNPERHLGDIALAFETVAAEARAQGKSIGDHAAHLIVHGFLHLLGYDHQASAEAERMEDKERAILAALGVADPYAADAEKERASGP